MATVSQRKLSFISSHLITNAVSSIWKILYEAGGVDAWMGGVQDEWMAWKPRVRRRHRHTPGDRLGVGISGTGIDMLLISFYYLNSKTNTRLISILMSFDWV